jgi:hypothetical protein
MGSGLPERVYSSPDLGLTVRLPSPGHTPIPEAKNMRFKAVIRALSTQDTDFPKPPNGEPKNRTITYFDREVDRDPISVTVPLERGIPLDREPGEFEEVVAVFQMEEIARPVTRTDRQDRSRTYDAVSKQIRLKVLDFEELPAKANGKAQTAAKAAA